MRKYKLLKMLPLCGAILILGSMTTGCVGAGNNNVSTPQADVADGNQHNLKDGFFMLQPGAGFDLTSNTAVSDQSCLAAAQSFNNLYVSNPEASVIMGDSIDEGHLEQKMGINVSGHMGGGVFSGSMRAAYLQQAIDNHYTLNLNYLYEYAGTVAFKPGTIGQGRAALTPVAESYAFGGDPVRFRQMCGNAFIPQMNAGVLLGVTITLNFDSFMDKENFQTALRGNLGVIHTSIMTHIQQAAKQSNVHVSMSLSALQLGGDPQDLNNIFGSVEPSGNYPYLDCGNVESATYHPCKDVISNVITYGKSIESQVESNGHLNMQKLYYTDATTEKYNTIGVNANAQDPSPQVLEAAQNLLAMYNTAAFNHRFAKHYLTTVPSLSTFSKVVLKSIVSRYDSQLNDVYFNDAYGVLECYRGYISTSCPQIESNVAAALAQSPYALTDRDWLILNYFQQNLYQGKVYGYFGQGTDQVSDYQYKDNNCMLYPVSLPDSQRYTLICQNDTHYPMVSGDLTITQVPMPGNTVVLSVNGLQYNAVNPEYPSYSQQISYPNGLVLMPESGASGYFTINNILVTGGQSFKINTAALKLTQLTKHDI